MSGTATTGLSSATTYQAIVIALVAAGIISIGVMSVCYRRRRRDEWERTVRAGMERARLRHGFPTGVGGDADIGEKPVLWDVDIGGEGNDWTPIRMGIDPSRRPTMTPNAITAPGPSDSNKSTDVELTILIAMPQPPQQPSTPGPSRSASMQSINLDSEPFGLGNLPHYRHTPNDNAEEEEELPYMELGTTVVPITIRTEEDEDDVMGMRMGSRAGIASDWGRGGTGGTS